MGKIDYVRKTIKKYSFILFVSAGSLSLSSCGTLMGGQVQSCQKRKPTIDHREIRPWAFAGDLLLFPVALPVDFYTGAIYRPCAHYSSMAIDRKAVRQFYR